MSLCPNIFANVFVYYMLRCIFILLKACVRALPERMAGLMVMKNGWVGEEDDVVHSLWWVQSIALAFVSMPPYV